MRLSTPLTATMLTLLAAAPGWALRVAEVSPAAPEPVGPTIILRDDFSSGGNLRGRYLEYDDAKGSFVWTKDEGVGGSPGALRCRFAKGQVTAGSLKVLFGRNPFNKGARNAETFREVYWRVYVKHQAGWQGNPAKLARLTTMAGTDWSQGLIAHVWGGKGDVLCIDPASGITNNRKVTSRYNDFDHLRWLGLRNGTTPVFSPAESGRWVCVECRVKVNTPGKADGIFTLWVDGRLEASRDDLDWQGTWQEYLPNALFLENYWNDGALKEESRWFDDLVISTQPIGPLRVAAVPTLTRTAGTTEWQAEVASDSEGKALEWRSNPLPAGKASARVSTDDGLFTNRRRMLPANKTYWVRLRERQPNNQWSEWSPWHSPFRT